MKPKQKDAAVIARVVQEVSEERRKVHEDLLDAQASLRAKATELNEGFDPLVKAQSEAESAIRAHERYKEGMSRQAFDAEARELERDAQKARAAVTVYREDARKQLAPLEQRLNTLQAKSTELAREWVIHERHAKAAGVDLSNVWREA